MVHSGLHGCPAPKVHVRRLITTRNPQCLGVLYVAADVRGVCTFDSCDYDRFNRIHLGTELLDIRIVCVRAGRSDHNEVATTRALTHPLKRSIDVRASAHKHEPGAERCSWLSISRITDNERRESRPFSSVERRRKHTNDGKGNDQCTYTA